jgi:hypothetical protein
MSYTSIKDSKSIVSEINELLKLLQWSEYNDIERMKQELVDASVYSSILGEKLSIDINEIILEKIEKVSLNFIYGKSLFRKS